MCLHCAAVQSAEATISYNSNGYIGCAMALFNGAVGPMRAVFEALGVQDVVAKSTGTSNPHNMVKATFDALQQMQSPRMVASRRGKKVADILHRDGAPAAPEAAEA